MLQTWENTEINMGFVLKQRTLPYWGGHISQQILANTTISDIFTYAHNCTAAAAQELHSEPNCEHDRGTCTQL